jgi:predicted enzyme related to lactoylglutathione lyase
MLTVRFIRKREVTHGRVSYMTVGSNDLEKAKAFYDALLGRSA